MNEPALSSRRLRRGDEVTVRVESLTHDGRGVARTAGKVLFVSDALPGERVTATVVRRRRNHDEAQLGQVLESSQERVTPRCEWYGVCGGCALQHLAPVAQLEHKQRWLHDALVGIGGVSEPTMLDALRGPVWNYRRRARLGVKYVDRKGRVLVGFRERRKPYVTDMRSCEVLEPRAAALIAPLQTLIGELSIRRRLPQIEVSHGETELVLALRVLDEPTSADIERLRRFEHEHDVILALQRGGPESVMTLDGRVPQLSYELPAQNLRLAFGATDFVQVNASINRTMIAAVIEHLQIVPDDRVLDLFCGLGNFTLPLARDAASVTGIEGSEALVARARDNAARNGIDNVQFVSADLAAAPETLPALQQRYDLVVLDPPRSGAEAFCRHAPQLGARRIVYVSCHPGTLARDTATLASVGYRLSCAGVIDMFPHTAHVESLAVFECAS